MMRVRQWFGNLRSFTLPALVVLVFAAAALPVQAAKTTTAAVSAEQRLRRDVTYLASDECEGRGPMTRGLDLAADYVAREFKKAGLAPAAPGGSYFQSFTIPGAILDAPATFRLEGPRGQKPELRQGKEFYPMGLGHAGKATAAALVFAGYGITSTTGVKYDDYAGLDVAGKVVVVLRGAPQGQKSKVAPQLWQFASFDRKLANAHKHKALAVLFVNEERFAKDGDVLLDFNFTALAPSSTKIPALHMRRTVLETMLKGTDNDLSALESAIDRDLKPHSVDLKDWKVSLEVRMQAGKVGLKNVVGVLEGAGPLAQETVVVGAHYDHLGFGGVASRSGGRKMAIHHGADDNGSGTTALMELARRFGAVKERRGRRLVFLAFSGEELGLKGSAFYCKEPLFPLANTAAMFNLDMVGRLRPDKKAKKDQLLVEGNNTSPAYEALLDTLEKKHDILFKRSIALAPNSDHFSFYKKKIPVLFFWTGYHSDYHMPGDTADKINVAGMRRVVDLSEIAVSELATMKRPKYQTVKLASSGGRPSSGPRLGIMPAYSNDKAGLLIDAVMPGGPADKAGLKEGDRIIEINGKPVKEIGTYMQAMSKQKKGTTIPIVILRSEKKKTVRVPLQ